MNTLLLIMGFVLTVLFFLNIRKAADVLCRIIGGFAVLFIYNAFAPMLSLKCVGINLLSALCTGVMGIPGSVLLLCAAVFL